METNDAKNQAKAQYESICRMLGALDVGYDRLEELKGEFKEWKSCAEGSAEVEGREVPQLTVADWAVVTEEGGELTELLVEADDCASQDEAQERLYESPLSVQVRSGWEDPGAKLIAYEFEILLCTGGPAVRIRGELDEHKQPDRARLEYRDWGTQWTPYHGAEQATLLAYASNFFYGE